MRKIGRLILAIFALCMFSLSSEAQTKTTSKTKTTTKSTKPKAAPKAISVYICDDGKDKIYHKYSSCKMLNKCGTEIKNIKDAGVLKKQRRKACTRCFSKQV